MGWVLLLGFLAFWLCGLICLLVSVCGCGGLFCGLFLVGHAVSEAMLWCVGCDACYGLGGIGS